MYSKNKGLSRQDYTLTPPPGYDGSRFRRRSDGRDDAFYSYSESSPKGYDHRYKGRETHKAPPPINHKESDVLLTEDTNDEICPVLPCPDDEAECENETSAIAHSEEKPSGISAFFQSIGTEEILLIALILLLANDTKANMDTVLILALLLCIS